MLFRLSVTVDVGELDRGPLTVGTYVGMLIVLRLSKSGIECVIWRGLAFPRCQRPKPGFWRSWLLAERAQRAIFQGFELLGT